MYSPVLERQLTGSSFYPERKESAGFDFDRWIYENFGYFLLPFKTGLRRYRKFINRVNRAESEYKDFSDSQLRSTILAIAGTEQTQDQEDVISRIFAGVRIAAHRTIELRHYDVQLLGGRVMLDGMVAEMETGAGKTLAATLPACCAALFGIPVHIITVNDYLAGRDAHWMGPIYNFFDLSVGVVTQGMAMADRQRAYGCAVTYCTNKEIVFDYLRDRLLLGKRPGYIQVKLEKLYGKGSRLQDLRLRGLIFAIIDEADSIMIDEARTPLILSGKSDQSYEVQMYRDALDIARQLIKNRDFVYESDRHSIRLTERGKQYLEDRAAFFGAVWHLRQWREDIIQKALQALHLFYIDVDYIVREDKVVIIDPHTGRTMPDRSWEHGLHQLIETKEGCDVTARNEPLARLSYQKFFRRYYHLAGMTGTAREVGRELWGVYGLPVITVPSHRPSRRSRCADQIYPDEQKKMANLLERVAALHAEGRPILIGTRSVESSERISAHLRTAGLAHRVLNAHQDQQEADIIKQAGLKGQITVATNMAGRGTDICLPEAVKTLGGLHIICTERHDSSRVDRQLFGRCGRQGDPGTYEYITSFEDHLLNGFKDKKLFWVFETLAAGNTSIRKWPAIIYVKWVQKLTERRHYRLRWNLMKFDESMESAIAFSGEKE